MSLQLLPADYSDMRELVEVIYAANSDPRDPFVDLCLPGLGAWSDATHDRGVEEVTKNYLAEWQVSNTQTWLKIVDTGTGKIVSASKWEIFDHNPYAEGLPHIKASWLPAGSRLREYTEWLINTRMSQAAARCQCPHVWLDICVTHPNSRHRGAASLSLQWGIEKADEMNVEAFIEATVDGAQLYERFGFVTKHIMNLRMEEVDADSEWRRLEEEYPLKYRWMERGKRSDQ
ncbi:GNAT acetyltransferase-like protein [Melanomma pulvis-pyrius CBS 109.77]|uniref:GNAT acetyltransferase-like protein n=1 Tax=Melanomma pulvis-pyrius CBS 109.77 TaxID=1314802 RepID=A0A6A6XKD7_9PLEO|nr:GNAT acetyltransferase-like protein [Melanomma pulvis-pyrius CBS 109.77]